MTAWADSYGPPLVVGLYFLGLFCWVVWDVLARRRDLREMALQKERWLRLKVDSRTSGTIKVVPFDPKPRRPDR